MRNDWLQDYSSSKTDTQTMNHSPEILVLISIFFNYPTMTMKIHYKTHLVVTPSIFSGQLHYTMLNQISNLSLAPGLFSYVLILILLLTLLTFYHEPHTQPHHPFFYSPIWPNKPLFMIVNYLEPHIFCLSAVYQHKMVWLLGTRVTFSNNYSTEPFKAANMGFCSRTDMP